MEIRIEYPPDYDGNLLIQTKRKKVHSWDEITFTFTRAVGRGDSEWVSLVATAKEILAQNERRGQGQHLSTDNPGIRPGTY